MIGIDPVTPSRINTAWNQLTADQQRQISPSVLSANQQAVTVSQTGKAPSGPHQPQQLLFAHTALTNDSDGILAGLNARAVSAVGPNGIRQTIQPFPSVCSTASQCFTSTGRISARCSTTRTVAWRGHRNCEASSAELCASQHYSAVLNQHPRAATCFNDAKQRKTAEEHS